MSFRKQLGTTYSKFQIGLAGLMWKVTGGKFRARNIEDDADMPIVGSIIAASGDDIELNESATNTGANRKFTLRRPSTGMDEARVLELPAGNPAPGQVFQVESYSGGVVKMSYLTVAAGTDKSVWDTTDLVHDSTSPIAMFTKPANSVILVIKVIIDEAFDEAASISVGVSGLTSKYLGATDVDLRYPAGSVFEADPGLEAEGSPESLIITFAANGATEGAARVLVEYVIPS